MQYVSFLGLEEIILGIFSEGTGGLNLTDLVVTLGITIFSIPKSLSISHTLQGVVLFT